MKKGHSQHNLEELILDELKTGPKKISRMILAIRGKRSGTSKQGVYAILRTLRLEEKVVAHGGFASLSNVWLQRMINYFAVAQHHYTTADTRDNSFLNLRDGEKAQYFFRDPVQMDAFWSHAFTILLNVTSVDKPFYLYNPHDWFLLARHANERALIDSVIKQGRFYRMTAGNRSSLDKSIAKEFKDPRAQYRMADEPLFTKQNYYLNILGDHLIEVYLDSRVTEKIDEFFRKYSEWSPKAQSEFEDIIHSRGKSKLVVSRNAKKAARLITLLQTADKADSPM